MMYDDVFRQPHVHLEDTEQNIEFGQEGHMCEWVSRLQIQTSMDELTHFFDPSWNRDRTVPNKLCGFPLLSTPFNPGIFGGVGQENSQKYFTWPHEIYPPHMFFGLPKEVGGWSSGCHILAQRWYGTPFHFRRTTYIHACIQPGPGETIINHIFLAEIFLGVGVGDTPPLLKYFSFYPSPTPP